jgi:HSP20 family protein
MILDAIAHNRVFPAHEAALAAPARSFAPSLDISETADQYEVRLDVPGVAKKDLKLTFEDETLTVEGERLSTTESAVRHERWYGSFKRTLQLPSGVDHARIEARLADGVLTIVLPKAEAAKPRQIEVR